MTQVPQTVTGALSPAAGIAPAVLDRVADAIFREHHNDAPIANDDTVWMRYARAAITEIHRVGAQEASPSRDMPENAAEVLVDLARTGFTRSGAIEAVNGQIDEWAGRDMFGHPTAALPRDWRVDEIDPGTPYADEPTEMIPPGVYLAAGHSDDPEGGPRLILKVEQVSGRDDDDYPDMDDVARQIADRLNGGAR